MGVHDNHRSRLKTHYLQQGADALTDQQLLELYLFYAIPRKDVNPLANRLLQTFGSLSGVFHADIESLAAVPEMGLHAATCLHLLPDLARRCEISRTAAPDQLITHWEDAGDYLLPYFFGAVTEQLYLLSLDLRGQVLQCLCLQEGSAAFAEMNLQHLVQAAIRSRAATVILAHNHPSGSLQPSPADISATLQAKAALQQAGITLADHLIIADGQFSSIRRTIPPSVWE